MQAQHKKALAPVCPAASNFRVTDWNNELQIEEGICKNERNLNHSEQPQQNSMLSLFSFHYNFFVGM